MFSPFFLGGYGSPVETPKKTWGPHPSFGILQESRLNTLDRFRKGEFRLLVATDVIGRGIDIPQVSHVIVFDMGSIDDYVHRIGRTARGKDGHGKVT